MRTIDNKSNREQGFLVKLKHDLVLLVRIIKMLVAYWVTGSRVRGEYRKCAREGTIYQVDGPVTTGGED